MMGRYVQDPNLSVNIVFLDEATFTLHGHVSRHNCQYWSDENPHWISERRTQKTQKCWNSWQQHCWTFYNKWNFELTGHFSYLIMLYEFKYCWTESSKIVG